MVEGRPTAKSKNIYKELYHTDVSKDLISTITDGIIEESMKWQNRALDSVYPILYLDCIYVKGRDNHTII